MLNHTRASNNDKRLVGSRQKTVLIVLSLHAILTVYNYWLIGETGGPSPTGFYSHYFIYTSMPTIFVLPFLPQSFQESTAATVCLLINGVCVAWLFGIGLSCLLYPRESGVRRRGEESAGKDAI